MQIFGWPSQTSYRLTTHLLQLHYSYRHLFLTQEQVWKVDFLSKCVSCNWSRLHKTLTFYITVIKRCVWFPQNSLHVTGIKSFKVALLFSPRGLFNQLCVRYLRVCEQSLLMLSSSGHNELFLNQASLL